jgi:NADH-quinone oxidoreductase subunit M
VSHLGFVVLGTFSFNQQGLDGAVYQMLNHGVSTGALFMLVGMLYERRHSLEIKAYGGVATVAPKLTVIFMITTLASIGLPLLNNFVGEFLVLQASALVNIKWTVFAALGVILSACYMLWMFQRAFLGETPHDVEHHVTDINTRELAAIAPLVILMVWMGVSTGLFLKPIGGASANILKQSEVNVEYRVASPDYPPSKEVANAR